MGRKGKKKLKGNIQDRKQMKDINPMPHPFEDMEDDQFDDSISTTFNGDADNFLNVNDTFIDQIKNKDMTEVVIRKYDFPGYPAITITETRSSERTNYETNIRFNEGNKDIKQWYLDEVERLIKGE